MVAAPTNPIDCAQPPDKLVSHPGQWPAKGHLALDALGNQFVFAQYVFLEVPILAVGRCEPRVCIAPSDPIPR